MSQLFIVAYDDLSSLVDVGIGVNVINYFVTRT